MYGLEEVCTQVNGLRISEIRVSAVYMTIHMYVSYEEKWVAWKRLPFDRGVIPYSGEVVLASFPELRRSQRNMSPKRVKSRFRIRPILCVESDDLVK